MSLWGTTNGFERVRKGPNSAIILSLFGQSQSTHVTHFKCFAKKDLLEATYMPRVFSCRKYMQSLNEDYLLSLTHSHILSLCKALNASVLSDRTMTMAIYIENSFTEYMSPMFFFSAFICASSLPAKTACCWPGWPPKMLLQRLRRFSQ